MKMHFYNYDYLNFGRSLIIHCGVIFTLLSLMSLISLENLKINIICWQNIYTGRHFHHRTNGRFEMWWE